MYSLELEVLFDAVAEAAKKVYGDTSSNDNAIRNMRSYINRQLREGDFNGISAYQYLSMAFSWRSSEEGFEFWKKISDELFYNKHKYNGILGGGTEMNACSLEICLSLISKYVPEDKLRDLKRCANKYNIYCHIVNPRYSVGRLFRWVDSEVPSSYWNDICMKIFNDGKKKSIEAICHEIFFPEDKDDQDDDD